MGVTRDYVLSLLTKDPEYKNRPKEFELRRERVRQYFDEGKSVKEMAAAEGISEEQIYAILKKLGLERRSKREKRARDTPNGWEWKWPLATNRILLATGGTPHQVPEHSKQAEKIFWEG